MTVYLISFYGMFMLFNSLFQRFDNGWKGLEPSWPYLYLTVTVSFIWNWWLWYHTLVGLYILICGFYIMHLFLIFLLKCIIILVTIKLLLIWKHFVYVGHWCGYVILIHLS